MQKKSLDSSPDETRTIMAVNAKLHFGDPILIAVNLTHKK
jgi:hypothetical protein